MRQSSRRRLLAGLGAAACTAGCLSDPDASESPTDDPARTPDSTTAPATAPTTTIDGPRADSIRIDLRNGFGRPVRVRVTVTADPEVISEQAAEVPADGRTRLDAGIGAVRDYTVAVDVTDVAVDVTDVAVDEVDVVVDETTIGIDGYDLDTGSDVIVTVGGEGIQRLL